MALAALPPSSTALVPFSHASPFTDLLQLPERRITVGARTFTIAQAWAPDGRGGTGSGAASHMGFGGSIYGSSIALAHHRGVACPSLIRGRRVLELGAGLALASLAAAAHGAAAVTAPDGDAAVVARARAAAARNGGAEGATCSVRQRRWGEPADAAATGAVDVVVAADVVAAPYARSLPALAATVGLLLPAPGSGVFVLAYQRRGSEEGAFFEDMAARGWGCTEVPREELLADFREPQRGAQPLQLFVFSKGGA